MNVVRLAWRESRTMRRRLLLYMSSVALGVAALVAIDSFATNVTTSVHDSSRTLLGGDLALTARAPLTGHAAAFLDSLVRAGADTAQQTTFASMATVRRTNRTRLTQVRAVTAHYPLAGHVTTEPEISWATLHPAAHPHSLPSAIVDPALLATLDARLGDTLTLGTAQFTLAGIIRSVPGDAGISASIGPRVFIAATDLPGTQLLTFGSRAEYKTLVALPHGARTPTRAWLTHTRPALDADHVRLQTAADAEVNLTDAVQRLSDFIGIVGLAALLLGGIGVASGVTAFVARKVDTVAILRCVGATTGQVLAIYVAQAAAMGVIGAAAGAVLGVAIQYLLPLAVRDFLPVDVTITLVPHAILAGLALGVWVAVLSALRPLLALRRVSPLQALRRDTDASALSRARHEPAALAAGMALAVTALGAARWRSGSWHAALATSLGIALAFAALWLSATALSYVARRVIRAGWPFALRQGIANLYRPANQTRAVMLALGFGAFLVATLYLVQSSLLTQFGATVAASRANLLFFDVQEDEAAPLDSVLRASGAALVEQTPIVTMRIADIRGAPAAAVPGTPRRAQWALRREYRSTYRDTLVGSEQIVAGQWVAREARSDSVAAVSLEDGVAKELGVGVGSRITWDVQGVRIPSRVTSLRHVDWARFQPNFFAVFQPGVLDGAPKQYVILTRVAGSDRIAQLERAVVDRYPNISSVDLSLIRETVNGIVQKVSFAIRFLAAFTLIMGAPVLFSAVAATRRDRVREGVLLKTLGATRSQVERIMLAEYAALGVLGSLTGMLLAIPAAWCLVHYAFNAPFTLALMPAFTVVAITAALTITIGLLGSRDVFSETPMAALRAP